MIPVALLAVALAAPVPKTEGPNSASTRAVLAELGLSDTFGKLADVPEGYAITAKELKQVRARPQEHPSRAAILKAGEVVAVVNTAPLPAEFRSEGGRPDRGAIRKVQEEVAIRTVELEEAADALTAVEKAAAQEAHPRWRAHGDLLTAYLLVETARLHEYNRALGQAIIQAEEYTLAEGDNGWRLVPDERMRSQKAIRDLARDGKERFAAVAKAHRGTPWGELATTFEDRPCGFKWESAKVK